MSATAIDVTIASNMLNTLADALDVSGPGLLKVYDNSAPQPANVTDAVPSASRLILTLTLSDPAFGEAAAVLPNAQATANEILPVVADHGIMPAPRALWFRAFDGNGTAIIDGDVSNSTGDGDLKMSSTTVPDGTNVSITEWRLLLPVT